MFFKFTYDMYISYWRVYEKNYLFFNRFLTFVNFKISFANCDLTQIADLERKKMEQFVFLLEQVFENILDKSLDCALDDIIVDLPNKKQ